LVMCCIDKNGISSNRIWIDENTGLLK